MKRRYDTALFRSRVELIRELMPHAFIGVDVIVGTRGEEERYFEECYQFLEGLPFSQLHVFSYSEREGTAASPSSTPSRPATSTSVASAWPASPRSVCRTSTAPTSVVNLRSSGSTATMTAA